MTRLLPFLVLATTTCLLGPALGFQAGCPKGCKIPDDPKPEHSGSIFSNNSNELEKYTITLTQISSDQYEVTLQGPTFIGFVLNVDGGMFLSNNDDVTVTQCNGGAAVTQRKKLSTENVKVIWKQTAGGQFTFRATVVKNFHYAVINIVQIYTV